MLAYQTTYKSYDKVKTVIPRNIYTYWDHIETMTPVIKNCIKSWYSLHPFYNIHVITDNNINEYLPHLKLTDSYRYNSELIRLSILAEKGGIWIDPSVHLTMNVDWVHSYLHYEQSELITFQKQSKCPVIDPFLIACKTNSSFMKRWKDEYISSLSFSISTYKVMLESEGIEFDVLHELTHLMASAQRVIHSGSEAISFVSSKGPLSSKWMTLYPFLPLLSKEPVIKYNKWNRSILEHLGLTLFL